MAISYRQEAPFEPRRSGVETEAMGGYKEQLDLYERIEAKYAPQKLEQESIPPQVDAFDNVVQLTLRRAEVSVAA